jgi:Tfp pilus assembly protein PilO
MKLGTRIWALITVIVVIAFVAGGYFLGVAPLLAQRGAYELARQAAVSQNEALQRDIDRLSAAEEHLDDYQDLAADFAKLIPGKVDSQGFIRGLDRMSAASGVTITKIAVDQFLPYAAPVDAGQEVSEKAPPPYTDPRINDQNFVLVPISVTVQGGALESLNFVHALQFGERLVLLMNVDQTEDGSLYSTTINAYMYVLISPGAVLDDEQVDQEAPPADPAEPTDDETASARG